MNPQRSFIQILVVPFLIGMLALSGYLIFKKNPEIMNQESFHSKLVGPREQSESKISSRNVREDLFNDLKITDAGRLSHRYVPIKDESYKAIALASHPQEWLANDSFVVTKEIATVTVAAPTGEVIWSFTLPEGNVFTPGMAPHLGSAIYLTTTGGRIYVFDLGSGQLVWYLQSQFKYFRSALISKSDLLLFVEEKSNQSWALQTLDAKTGDFKQSIAKLEMPLSGDPILVDNYFYFSTENGHLTAIDLGEGTSAWTTEASSSFRSGPAAIGERIYLTNEDGLALGFDRKSGKKVNEIEVGSSVQEPLKLVEGTNIAITIDSNGYLVAIDLKLAKRLWRYNLNMLGSRRHPFSLHKLSTKTLTQLNFASEFRGWSAWTTCSSSRICIFDVKAGQMLHRIELKGEPVAQFEFVGPEANLLVPVKSGSGAKIIGLQIPVVIDSAATATDSAAPAQPVVDK